MAMILFFGSLGDAAQSGERDLPQGISTISALIDWLGRDNAPLLEALTRTGNRVAVNKVMSDFNAQISNRDEIAFMSPLSGG